MTRSLHESEHLLVKQCIKGNQKLNTSALARYYQQPLNTRVLGVPWLLLSYQLGKRRFEPDKIRQRIAQAEQAFAEKIRAAQGNLQQVKALQYQRDKRLTTYRRWLQEGNWLMRWGEPPAIYSESQRTATMRSLKRYMQSQGYLDATVRSEVTLQNQEASVVYHVQENTPYRVEKAYVTTADKAIAQILRETQAQSLLRQGMRYDQEVLQEERDRIHSLLQERGYYQFDKQYINFNVHVADTGYTVSIETVVGLPPDKSAHPTFTVQGIRWTHAGASSTTEQTLNACPNITFRGIDKLYTPYVLARQIPTWPPHSYQRSQDAELLRRLSKVNMFKQIHVTQEILAPGQLLTHIHTHPSDQFRLSGEVGFQSPYSFVKGALGVHNVSGNLDAVTLAMHMDTANLWPKKDYVWGMDATWTLPQFLLPLSAAQHRRSLKADPTTKVEAGINIATRPEYVQHTYKGLWSYTWRGWGHGDYVFVPVRINVIDTRQISADFRQHLQALRRQGSNLYRAFEKPSWVTCSALKATFSRLATATDRSQRALVIAAESAGLSQTLLDLRRVSARFEYFQYVRLDLDYSQCIPVGRHTTLAYRANTGIAAAYGPNKLLPYDRYYFAGGARSVRAWQARSLGPGTHRGHFSSRNEEKKLEQPGELLLQASVELRQQLTSLLEGAAFIDVGNVWMLQRGPLESQFDPQQFYRDMAVGTGMGLRLNLQFLILRFDVGLKLYDPTYPRGQRMLLHKLAAHDDLHLKDQITYHLDIGYPF